jgi:hypothetical protein
MMMIILHFCFDSSAASKQALLLSPSAKVNTVVQEVMQSSRRTLTPRASETAANFHQTARERFPSD